LAGAKRLARAADFAGLLAWRRGTRNGLAGGSLPLPLADLKFGHYNARRVRLLPSRSEERLQWHASTTFALQSRGGDGVAPSSRARSPRLMGRGKARCGLWMSEARGLRVEVDKETSTYSKKALCAAGRRESSPQKAALGKPVREFRAGAPLPEGQREDICHGASEPPGRRIRPQDSVHA
jgi:hypothetical protein